MAVILCNWDANPTSISSTESLHFWVPPHWKVFISSVHQPTDVNKLYKTDFKSTNKEAKKGQIAINTLPWGVNRNTSLRKTWRKSDQCTDLLLCIANHIPSETLPSLVLLSILKHFTLGFSTTQ
ncbi:hypothetical protein CY35_02G044800 [Sphagnum magellanicum]|jgi:hypothetical protein|nr:hypothetical protein CY35_02G044800 [Sphagnum magellanicum]